MLQLLVQMNLIIGLTLVPSINSCMKLKPYCNANFLVLRIVLWLFTWLLTSGIAGRRVHVTSILF